MYHIEKTDEFDKWLRKLKDLRAKAKILFRIQKIENDEHFGDCEAVGSGIRELKVDYARWKFQNLILPTIWIVTK